MVAAVMIMMMMTMTELLMKYCKMANNSQTLQWFNLQNATAAFSFSATPHFLNVTQLRPDSQNRAFYVLLYHL